MPCTLPLSARPASWPDSSLSWLKQRIWSCAVRCSVAVRKKRCSRIFLLCWNCVSGYGLDVLKFPLKTQSNIHEYHHSLHQCPAASTFINMHNVICFAQRTLPNAILIETITILQLYVCNLGIYLYGQLASRACCSFDVFCSNEC